MTNSTAFRARAAGDNVVIIHVVDELAARGVGATGLPGRSRLFEESNAGSRVQTARDGAVIEVVAKRVGDAPVRLTGTEPCLQQPDPRR